MTDAREIAPTDSGIEELDSLCRRYNSRQIDLCSLVCGLWNNQQVIIESQLAALAAKDAEIAKQAAEIERLKQRISIMDQTALDTFGMAVSALID